MPLIRIFKIVTYFIRMKAPTLSSENTKQKQENGVKNKHCGKKWEKVFNKWEKVGILIYISSQLKITW